MAEQEMTGIVSAEEDATGVTCLNCGDGDGVGGG